MNFKKFISGVSALTIAASVLTITAGAADTSKPAKLSVDYTAENASTTGWTLESGTESAPATLEVVAGTGLKLSSGNNGRTRHGTATNMFENDYDGDVTVKMTVHFVDSTSANATDQLNRLAYFEILDASSNSIVKFTEDGQGRNALVDDTVVAQNGSAYRGSTWTVTADINFVQGTLSYTVVTNQNNQSFNGTKQISATSLGGLRMVSSENISSTSKDKGAIELQKFEVYQDEVSTKYYDYAVEYKKESGEVVKSESGKAEEGDTIPYSDERFTSDVDSKLYIVDDTEGDTTVNSAGTAKLIVNCHEAASYPINVYSSLDTAKSSPLYSATMREGDGTLTYRYPKYLTSDDNKVTAKITTEGTYTATITEEDAPTKGNAIVIDYTSYTDAYTSTAYFYEFDGTAPPYPHMASNGQVAGANGNPSITVPVDGTYNIEVVGYSTAGGGRYLTVVKGDYEEVDGTPQNVLIERTETPNGGKILSAESVELKAGDKITVHGSASTATLDYILLVKTDEDVSETVEADPVGEASYTDEETGKVYTPFTAIVKSIPTAVKVTGVDGEEYDGTITNETVITDSAVKLGIIVIGDQKAAKVVFTVE